MASGSGILRETLLWALGCGAVFTIVLHADTIAPMFDRNSEFMRTAEQVIAVAMGNEDALLASNTREQPQQNTSRGRKVVLQADAFNQFFADARINGRPIRVLVDTGASHVSLTYEDARRLGIYVRENDFTVRTQTANGIARAAPVTIDRIRLGRIMVHNVKGLVGERGAKSVTLLGMSFLGRLQSVGITGRQMQLVR